MAPHGALLIASAILLCSCFVLLQCTVVAASAWASSHEQDHEQEIRRPRSKVASLEDEVSGRKEETSQLEGIVREKTTQIAALVGGLEIMQVTNVADDESVMKASTSSAMLEKQVTGEAELKAEELAMVRGMWLPYWFASRSIHCQELATAKWRLHGKPVLDTLMLKVAETLRHVQRLAGQHLQATQNVQEGIRRSLEDNELLKLNPLSAHRLAWWTASASLFALPIFSVYKIFSATIWKKIQARASRGRGRGKFSRRKHARRVGK